MMKVRWGVLGVGRAGRARVAALRADPRVELVGGWRGDLEGNELHAFSSFDEMLQHVDAVAICSPDDFHASQVHAALSAHRHVVVEFPAASSAGEASSLYALAVARDRVLHVEHIELLTPDAQWLRGFAAGKTLLGGSVRFFGGARTNVVSPAHANIARLQRIIDAVGVPEDVEVERCTPANLAVQLQYRGGVEVHLDCRMGEGVKRHFEMALEFEEGMVRAEDGKVFLDGSQVELEARTPLFEADQLAASAAILDGQDSYISMEQILDGLGLADLVMGAS